MITVFIGRFSPFHNGHADVLSRALLRSDQTIVIIGTSYTSRNIKNPFTFDERKSMIQDWYNEQVDGGQRFGTMHIEPAVDYPYNDQEWIAQIQDIVNDYALGQSKPVLTGASRDESSWYLKAFGDFFELDLVTETKAGLAVNATQIRDAYFTGSVSWATTPETTRQFLANFSNTEWYKELQAERDFVQKYKDSWKSAPYAPTFVTVDAVVIQSGHILVVQRAAQPGRGLWALPGGFIEQNERLQDACIRELSEETRIELSKAQLVGSIAGREVFDHPGRSMRGRTITHAFLFRLKDTVRLPRVKPQPGEVQKVMWLPLAQAKRMTENWFEDHHAIMTTMLGRE